ncbi:MAG: hypothetical protein R2932_04835 [Caldilineaceae bacterium]
MAIATWSLLPDGRTVEVAVKTKSDPVAVGLLDEQRNTSAATSRASYAPVRVMDNLLPLAINACDCIKFDQWPINLDASDFETGVVGYYQLGNINHYTEFTLDLPSLDPAYPSTHANRRYFQFYVPDDRGVHMVYQNGTAHTVARAVNVLGDGFLFDFSYSDPVPIRPEGQLPVCFPSGCPDTTDWVYYTAVRGTLVGLPGTRYADAVIDVHNQSLAIQVGTNAHLYAPQPSYGGAGKLILDVVKQPSTGVTLREHTDNTNHYFTLVPIDPPDVTAFNDRYTTAQVSVAMVSDAIHRFDDRGSTITSTPPPCAFAWLDWDGVEPSTLELVDALHNPNDSGPRAVDDWVSAGPQVESIPEVAAALDQWIDQPANVVLYDNVDQNDGYQICGFGKFTLTAYSLDTFPRWLQGHFTTSMVTGATADPNAADYGVRTIFPRD